jgi:tetrapyrrole methylase family protein/MazG family protein
MTDIRAAEKAFAALVETMHTLRAPGGCPWDAEQTHESLEAYLIEEAYEALDAIARGSDADLCDELGDVLLQVIFHAEIAAERRAFTIADVSDAIRRKLVRRHPHVFSDTVVSSSAEVAENWQRIKREERAAKNSENAETASALDGVPKGMPGLLRAHRLSSKAAAVGFDWENVDGAANKVREELAEVEAAVAEGADDRVADEIGDLLFAAVNLARKLGTQSEGALHGTLDRFERRFHAVEAELRANDRDVVQARAEELDALWESAKADERKRES